MITLHMQVPGGTKAVTISESDERIVVETGLTTAKKKKRQETLKSNLPGSVEEFVQEVIQSYAVQGYEMATNTADTGGTIVHMATNPVTFDPDRSVELEHVFGLEPAKTGVADRKRWSIGGVTVSASAPDQGQRKLSFSSSHTRGYLATAFLLMWSPTTKVFVGNDEEVDVRAYLQEAVKAKVFSEEILNLLYASKVISRPFNLPSLSPVGHALAMAM